MKLSTLLHSTPLSRDLGLLVLRIWIGLTMMPHGKMKLGMLQGAETKFLAVLGLSPQISLMLAIAAELAGSMLLILGLLTRLSAGALAFTMGVAFFVAHKGSLDPKSAAGSGELALVYMAVYVALLVAGPGRFSFDALIGATKPKA